MGRHESHDELYEAELARMTGEKAFMIMAAIKGGQPLNTKDMIEHLDVYLGDQQALADLILRTANGENAFLELIVKISREMGETQALYDLKAEAAHRRELSIADRIHRYLDSRAA